jgi:mycothiol synthase
MDGSPSASLPEGHRVRPATEDDLVAVSSLLAAYDVAHLGSRDLDPQFLLEGWRRPGFDMRRDTWVVSAPDGKVVGYGEVVEEEPGVAIEAFGRVHPAVVGRGVGSALVAITEQRARELRAGAGRVTMRLRNAVAGADARAGALLAGRGYVPVRNFWHMEVELTDEHAAPTCPDGITIRRFETGQDDRAVHRVIQEAFRDHWGRPTEPFDQWGERFLRGPGFDEELWFVAMEQERVVGALIGRMLGGRPWVMDLGVLSEGRGRGIGTCLLLHAFARFRRRGERTVTLNVDAENESGATRLYERVGMRVVRRWDVYERAV